MVCAQLRLECECACDDAVLRGGVEGPRYAEHLLDLARAFVRTRGLAQASALARRSTLEYRVRAMLARGTDRSQLRRAGLLTVATMMLIAAVAAAGYGESASEPPSVVSPAPPRRLTLLLDGRIMDLSKEWPSYPDPRAGIVEGARFGDAMR
jgi:beta-lactamase regulating signal transducer with metallopeptidase domain